MSTTQKNNTELKINWTPEKIAETTGLTAEQCRNFMDVNHLSGNEAYEVIDIFSQFENNGVEAPLEIIACLRNAGIYSEMSNRLNTYNTMRGGVKGYSGFVFEELHAADAAVKGVDIKVLANNSIADFIVKDSSGHETLVQAKAGYKPNQVDWDKYKGQTIVVDKGNTALANEASAAGLKVQESAISKKQADFVAKAQQWESKVIGNKTNSAPITGTAVGAHNAGLSSAKFTAKVGVPMKLGENIYDVVSGKKEIEDAAADVIVDGAVMVGEAYLGSAALTTAATAFAGTTTGAAVTGAVTSAITAVGSTAIGGAVLAGASTVATAAASTVAAVAAAPLAPVVAVGAAVGFLGKWISDNW